jgi:hypothetical protein
MLELGYHSLGFNFGYYIDKIPQEVFNELKLQVDSLQNNFINGEKYNNHLVGEIYHEYKIHLNHQCKNYIKHLTKQVEDSSNYIKSNYTEPLNLEINDDVWINFQKKHEYNPPHNHSGIYSFVIWYQIPYTIEDEINHSPKSIDQQPCVNGLFSFLTPNLTSRTRNIDEHILEIDSSKQGYVAIFPSILHHLVYPFYTSNSYRITIAGNIKSNIKI